MRNTRNLTQQDKLFRTKMDIEINGKKICQRYAVASMV